MSNHGDVALTGTLDFHFTTRRFTTGVPFMLAGSPVLSAYPDNSLAQLTAGITLTINLDGVVGLNHVRVVPSGANGYVEGSRYTLVLTAGTVDGVSVVGEVVGSFRVRTPVSDPALSAIQAKTDQLTFTTAGKVDASLLAAADLSQGAADKVWLTPTRALTDKGGFALSAAGIQAVWDALTVVLTTVGSIGRLFVDTLDAAISSRLPTASYTAPLSPAGIRSAMGLASPNLDTQLSGLASYIDTEVAAILAAVDPGVAAIKAKTDQLTFTNAGKVDAALLAAADLGAVVGQKVADMVLRRVAANVEASSFGDALHHTSLYGLIQKASASNTTAHPGMQTVFRANGTTELAQIPLTTDPAADGITGIGV